MLFISQFFLSLLLYLSFASAVPSETRSTFTVIPITGINMGAVELPSGDTRIYYQDATSGDILQVAITNAFNVGVLESANVVIVPGSEVRQNSPVAVSVLNNGDAWEQIHVVFFSPDNVLSEYYWESGIGFQGGINCTTCVTNKGFFGAAGSQMLYALASSATSPPVLRIGFVLDSGDSNTLSEAINSGSGWSVATLT